jgi:uncharacterized RDD family membrane protein YckC
MSTPEAGWYDDPWSAEQYRYWDGNAWTHHAAPKHFPPQPAVPTPPAGTSYGGNPYGPYGNTSTGGNPYAAQPGPQPGPQLAPGTAGPYAGDWRPTFGPTTPDGAPLSGWWRRAGAWLLDQLIVYVLALPLAAYFWYQAAGEFGDYFDDLVNAADAGQSSTTVTMPSDLQLHILLASLITLAVAAVYQAVMLRRSGATWGKQAAGIKVRPRDADIQLSWTVIGRRVGFIQGLALLSAVPLLGIFAGIALLLDYLWPLWDSKNQALHDKVASTNVVRTR